MVINLNVCPRCGFAWLEDKCVKCGFNNKKGDKNGNISKQFKSSRN